MSDNRTSDQRDAARYRYLRNQPGKPTPEEFDAAIDADMEMDGPNSMRAERLGSTPVAPGADPVEPPTSDQQPPMLNLRVHQGDEVIVDAKELGQHLRWYKDRLREPPTSKPLSLVDRLRDMDSTIRFDPAVCRDAAHEIERLRAALKTVGDDYPGSSCQQWCYEQAGLVLPDVAAPVASNPRVEPGVIWAIKAGYISGNYALEAIREARAADVASERRCHATYDPTCPDCQGI